MNEENKNQNQETAVDLETTETTETNPQETAEAEIKSENEIAVEKSEESADQSEESPQEITKTEQTPENQSNEEPEKSVTAENKPDKKPEENSQETAETEVNPQETDKTEPARHGKRELIPEKNSKKSKAETGGKPVMIYILLLFGAALLLMGLSSLMHQRNNQQVLGELRADLSDLRKAQDLQNNIIELQKARQESEDQLKEAQKNLNTIVSQTQEDRNRSEALQYLYLLMMETQMEHYQSCQTLIQEMESRGLEKSLPAETIGSAGLAAGVASPLDRYYQIKETIAARIAEGLPPQTVDAMNENWIPEREEVTEDFTGEFTGEIPVEVTGAENAGENNPENNLDWNGEENNQAAVSQEWEPGPAPESPIE